MAAQALLDRMAAYLEKMAVMEAPAYNHQLTEQQHIAREAAVAVVVHHTQEALAAQEAVVMGQTQVAPHNLAAQILAAALVQAVQKLTMGNRAAQAS